MDTSVAQRGVGSPWETQILYASNAYGIHVALIKAVISQESAWNPNAVNLADPSYGLMQINTRAHPDVTPEQMLVPEANITYGSNYLAQQVQRYGLSGGISAYNAGHPISGNQSYVNNVLAYKAWFEQNDPASSPAAAAAGDIFTTLFGPFDDELTPTPVMDTTVPDDSLVFGGMGLGLLLLVGGLFFLMGR